ncbi:MAG: 5'-3' exonuclease [Campylobacterota bacterium]
MIALIDTSSLIYYAFYNAPKQSLSFKTFFLKLIQNIEKKLHANEYLFALDSSFLYKQQRYPHYKADRKSSYRAIKAAKREAFSLLQNCGYTLFKQKGYEADDIIASLAFIHKTKQQLVIVAVDKDFMQLLNKNISIYNYIDDIYQYKDNFVQQYGFEPTAFVDYLALVGDRADTIKGVKGVGKKAARKLLQQYKDLDAIYANVDKISNQNLQQSLKRYKEDAFISKTLVKLQDRLTLNQCCL